MGCSLHQRASTMIGGLGGLGASFEDLSQGTPRVTLVLGGARSGKSSLAERLTLARGSRPFYLATAPFREDAPDPEMSARIARHRQDRALHDWTTIEAGRDLPRSLMDHGGDPGRPLLVDCLVLWLGTLMMDAFDGAPGDEGDKARLARSVEPLALAGLDGALDQLRAPIVLVSGEVGLGVVPTTPLGRAFQDVLGRVNQHLSARADRVLFCVAGLPLVLKDPSPIGPVLSPVLRTKPEISGG